MELQKVYINEKDEATILCPTCGRKRTLIATKYKEHYKPVAVKCPCGVDFPIIFEKRRHYRKSVDLVGSYTLIDPPGGSGEMSVKDISRSGVGFETDRDIQMEVNDIVKVKFILDDGNLTAISKNVIVRFAKGRRVGAKFCDEDIGKPLASYLMP